MTTYYRNEYLFSEIYLQEITQQPEDTEILASLTTLKEYREFARTATIQEWKESFVHEVLYALRFNIKIENERLTLLYPVGNMETPLTLCYVLLPTEDLDNTTMGRNWAEKVIRSLRHHNLKWGLLTNGEQWRMYHLDESTPYEIFLEINLAAILSDSASQAYQIFHKFMKVENFTISELGQCRLDVFKKESLAKIDYIESELANALKQKEEGGKGVLSNLCMGYVDFLKAGSARNFDDDALRRKIYHGAMLYMFRLLFLFYADARGLLNEKNSKLLNDVLRRGKASSANNTSASGCSIWEDLERIFVDIDQSYNGGLFDPHESEFTQFIEESRVNDGYLASALHYLTSYQERSKEEKAISYRDMSVRHLGTLYEGLLEHKLFITTEDTEVRAAKDKIQFIPASQGGKIVAGRYIPAGQVYFGSDRSERKATGSFYTPEYIVDYIVRNTVGEKLSQLRKDFLAEQKDLLSAVGKAIDQKERKALTELLEDNLKTFIREKVLKLSVLDPGMGSGHFLVNTSNYIANFITEILNEFEIIGTTETSTTYWRRWVVENCVYGVDVNPLAVELAKLSLWILSMSKEKPLSFLNHNLKTGNSLIGARLDDIGKYPGKGDKKQPSIFSDDRDFKEAVGKAISNYARIKSTDSASLDVIAEKKAWLDEIDEILKPYKLVCDMHTSIYFGNEISEWKYKELIDTKDINAIKEKTNNLRPFFHWDLEFPSVLIDYGVSQRGFDITIGNPPYLRELDSKYIFDEIALTSFGNQYRSARMDLWYFFVHRGIEVLRNAGVLSFITNSYWMTGTGAEKLIAELREKTQLDEVFSLKDLKVFNNVSGQHVIFRLTKGPNYESTTIKIVNPVSESSAETFVRGISPIIIFKKTTDRLFVGSIIDIQPSQDSILDKINKGAPLSELGIIRQGIAENPSSINRKTNEKYGNQWDVGEGVFVLSPQELENLGISDEEKVLIHPYHHLCDLDRYYIAEVPSYFIIYSSRYTCPDINKFPIIGNHLERFRVIMEGRRETMNDSNSWWHLHWPRDERLWNSAKIISIQMAARPSFVPVVLPAYVPFSTNVFVPNETTSESIMYLAGILNSRLLWIWFNHHSKRRGVGLEINGHVFSQAPIKRIDFKNTENKRLHDQIVSLVSEIIKLKAKLNNLSLDQESSNVLADQIARLDRNIDMAVYNLYDLNDEEIQSIEEGF